MKDNRVDLAGKRFGSVANSGSGEVGSETIFNYHQRDDIIWADYQGGAIRFGTLTGLVLKNGQLDFRYAHVNSDNEIMTGRCLSTPEILPDGRLRLHETWQWSSGDFSSGNSIIEELMK